MIPKWGVWSGEWEKDTASYPPLPIRLASEILLLQLTSGGFIVFNDPHQVVGFSGGIFAMAFLPSTLSWTRACSRT